MYWSEICIKLLKLNEYIFIVICILTGTEDLSFSLCWSKQRGRILRSLKQLNVISVFISIEMRSAWSTCYTHALKNWIKITFRLFKAFENTFCHLITITIQFQNLYHIIFVFSCSFISLYTFKPFVCTFIWPLWSCKRVSIWISTTNILTLLVTGCLDKSVTCQSQEILRSVASKKSHTVQWCECCWNAVDEKDVNVLEMVAIRSCHSITCKSKYLTLLAIHLIIVTLHVCSLADWKFHFLLSYT